MNEPPRLLLTPPALGGASAFERELLSEAQSEAVPSALQQRMALGLGLSLLPSVPPPVSPSPVSPSPLAPPTAWPPAAPLPGASAPIAGAQAGSLLTGVAWVKPTLGVLATVAGAVLTWNVWSPTASPVLVSPHGLSDGTQQQQQQQLATPVAPGVARAASAAAAQVASPQSPQSAESPPSAESAGADGAGSATSRSIQNTPRTEARQRSAAAGVGTDVSAELRWLDPARAALAQGQAGRALKLLEGYERAFPRGMLRKEAELLRDAARGPTPR